MSKQCRNRAFILDSMIMP